ncbi:MAG: hypothetical protein ABJ327_20590 [Litoreibacter sp.]
MRYVLILMTFLGACTNASQDTDDTSYPRLIPLGDLYAAAQEDSQIDVATAELQARAARLRQKAAALRGRSIVDGQDRLRLLR